MQRNTFCMGRPISVLLHDHCIIYQHVSYIVFKIQVQGTIVQAIWWAVPYDIYFLKMFFANLHFRFKQLHQPNWTTDQANASTRLVSFFLFGSMASGPKEKIQSFPWSLGTRKEFIGKIYESHEMYHYVPTAYLYNLIHLHFIIFYPTKTWPFMYTVDSLKSSVHLRRFGVHVDS